MINVLETGRILAKILIKTNFKIGDTETYFGQNTEDKITDRVILATMQVI